MKTLAAENAELRKENRELAEALREMQDIAAAERRVAAAAKESAERAWRVGLTFTRPHRGFVSPTGSDRSFESTNNDAGKSV